MPLTVGQLIEKLQEYPPYREVALGVTFEDGDTEMVLARGEVVQGSLNDQADVVVVIR